MKCAILQPSYIPWRGFFHQIQKSDVFVYYDDVQYDKHGWRNRNRVKTANGPTWLTVPVIHKGNVSEHRRICDIAIAWDSAWNTKHWNTLKQAYGKAPHFARYAPMLEELYRGKPALLTDLTIPLTTLLARELGIETRFVKSSELGLPGDKTDRLIAILKSLGVTHYISGPAAQAYLEEDKLAGAGIALEYMSYDYPEYAQLHGAFEPKVSVLDLLFMKGPEAGTFIWGAR